MVVGKERDRIPGFRWRWCRIASSGSNTVGLLLLFKMIKKAFLSSASCFNSCLVFQTLLWVPSVSKVVQPVGERRNSEILVLLFWSSSNKTLARLILQWQYFLKVQLLVPARKNVRFYVLKHPINFFPIFFAVLSTFRAPENFRNFPIFRLFALPSKQP